MNKMMSLLVAAVFAAVSFNAAAQASAPAPTDQPSAQAPKAHKKSTKSKKAAKSKKSKKAAAESK
jgi:outer membrane lipoprotein-sorting protein